MTLRKSLTNRKHRAVRREDEARPPFREGARELVQGVSQVGAKRMDALADETERGWTGQFDENGFQFARTIRGVKEVAIIDQALDRIRSFEDALAPLVAARVSRELPQPKA